MEPIEVIRLLSGIFENCNEKMQNRLALINMISRAIVGDADKDYVYEVCEKQLNVKIDWNKDEQRSK
jgi:hypothetical protein